MAPRKNHQFGQTAVPRRLFEIETVQKGDAFWLRLSGELDLASVEELEEAIRLAEDEPARAIVVDLADLQFMDSTGLQVLLEAYARSRENGQRLKFLPSRHESVRQLVAVTGTSEIFA